MLFWKVIICLVMAVPFIVIAMRNIAIARAANALFDCAEELREKATEKGLLYDHRVLTMHNNLLALASYTPFMASNMMKLVSDWESPETTTLEDEDALAFLKENLWLYPILADSYMSLEGLAWYAKPFNPIACCKTLSIAIVKHFAQEFRQVATTDDRAKVQYGQMSSAAEQARSLANARLAC